MRRTLLAAIRTAIAAPIVVLDLLILGPVMVLLSHRNPASRNVQRVVRLWARIFLVACGVKLDVAGKEHLDPSRSYVFVANHSSNIDIPVNILAADPIPIRYLAKKELFTVPVLGWVMNALRMVRTDRQARRVAHEEINQQLAEIVPLGLSLMIYPEGTRTRSGDVGGFKRGAFRIAVDNQLDVVPVSVAGTYGIFPPGSKLIYGGHARVIVHRPLPVAGRDRSAVGELLEASREAIVKGLAELERV